MFKQDWMERQISAIADSIAAVLFGKDKLRSVLSEYEEEEETSTDIQEETMKRIIKKYIDEKKYSDAEDMIFKLIEFNSSAHNLEIALSFYNELYDLKEEQLNECNFSKEKINEGIEKLKKFYD